MSAARTDLDMMPPSNEQANASMQEQAIIGCLWGTAVGDALGLSCEGLSKARQRRMFPDTTRYHFLFGRGMVSDDTEHTWMTAQALLVSPNDPDRFGRSLAWQMRVWLLCVPAGAGLATLRAILRLWLGWGYTRSGVYSAGNGPAMRSALLGVCYGNDPERLRGLVRVCTRITHTDPKAESGALLIAVAAHLAASGQAGARSEPIRTEMSAHGVLINDDVVTRPASSEPENYDVTRQARTDACCACLLAALPSRSDPFAPLVEQARQSVNADQTTEDFAASLGLERGVSGYVCHTVPIVLHAWLRYPDDYAQAVQAVIRCGGDTDTTGAIVGAIVGAGVGRDGIRTDWRAGLWEWPHTGARMERLGASLAASLADQKARPAVRVSLIAVLARNLLFLIVILLHGFRRLLPPY